MDEQVVDHTGHQQDDETEPDEEHGLPNLASVLPGLVLPGLSSAPGWLELLHRLETGEPGQVGDTILVAEPAEQGSDLAAMMNLMVEQVYRENPGRQSAGLAICEADKRKGTFQPLDRQLVDPLLDFPVRMFPCLAQFVEVLVQDVLVGEFPKRLIPKAGQPHPVAPEDVVEGGMDGLEGGAQILPSLCVGNLRTDGENLDIHPVVIVGHDFVVSQ